MHHFFTTESTAPPAISALWYSVMVLLIVTAIMMSLRYYQNEQFRKCFQYIIHIKIIHFEKHVLNRFFIFLRHLLLIETAATATANRTKA